jgi:hypothetical protein
MNIDAIHILAKLTLYTTENGGRRSGISTGYRPNHVFEYFPNSNEFRNTYIGQIDFDKDKIQLGEGENVQVQFLKHHNIEEFLTKGRIWWIHEGRNKIGEAEILEIITE